MFTKNALNMFAIASAFLSIEPSSRTNSLMLFCFSDLASDFRAFHIPFEFPLLFSIDSRKKTRFEFVTKHLIRLNLARSFASFHFRAFFSSLLHQQYFRSFILAAFVPWNAFVCLEYAF